MIVLGRELFHFVQRPNNCKDCNVDVNVGHTLFVHGYASNFEGFEKFDNDLKEQNQCAGYNTYRVSIGQDGGQKTFGYTSEISCAPNEMDGRCVGHCTQHGAQGRCISYDRTKNGICGNRIEGMAEGRCVSYHKEGARKFFDVWAEDLAYFFENNRLNDLPDRSVTIVIHSTGGPAVLHFMARGYEGDPRFALGSRKVKQVITIQGAMGGACGAGTVGTLNDDASIDLGRLSNGVLKYDFRHATYDGSVPWTHIQTFGSKDKECLGSSVTLVGIGPVDVSTYTGLSCLDYTHDGVTQNWDHNTSRKHPFGAGKPAGNYPFNITVHEPEAGYCHTATDPSKWPSYRDVPSRFRKIFGREPVAIDVVKNLNSPQTWWPMVLNPWRDL